MTTELTTAELNRLSTRIADLGMDELGMDQLGMDVERDLQRLARFAHARGLAPVSTSVMTDRWTPLVVRQRAFAKVCRAVTSDAHAPIAELALAS